MSKGGTIAVVIVGLLVLAGLGVGLYLTLNKSKSKSGTKPPSSASPKARCFIPISDSKGPLFEYDATLKQFTLHGSGTQDAPTLATLLGIESASLDSHPANLPLCGIRQPNGATQVSTTTAMSKQHGKTTLGLFAAAPMAY